MSQKLTYHDLVKSVDNFMQDMLNKKELDKVLEAYNRVFDSNITPAAVKERTKVTVSSNVEGPKDDPYGYTEFKAIVDGRIITLHMGLAEWLHIKEGVMSQTLSGHGHRYEFNRHGKRSWDEWENGMLIERIFESITGRDLEEVYEEYMMEDEDPMGHPMGYM